MDVRTLCLAVLYQGDATGYEIKKAFEEGPFHHFQTASFGSIYPALSRLLQEGLIAEGEAILEGRSDKKAYRLTENGLAKLIAAVNREPDEDSFRSDLLFQMFFSKLSDPDGLSAKMKAFADAYASKAAHIEEKIAERQAEGCVGDPGREIVAGFGVAIYRAAADYLDTHREALVAELKASAVDAAE